MSPIPNTPTICSALHSLYFFNPNLRIDSPVEIINPIVIIGNLSVAANITIYTNSSGAPLTTAGCLAIEGGTTILWQVLSFQLTYLLLGTLIIVLDKDADDLVVANTRCITGTWGTIELQPDPSDCRKYSVKGQDSDKAAGTFNVLLSVDRYACDATKVCRY